VGLRVCVCVLIINVVVKLRKHSIVDLSSAVIFVVVFILSVYMLIPVALLVMMAGICGIAIMHFRKNQPPNGGAE
jgi:chromate transporter